MIYYVQWVLPQSECVLNDGEPEYATWQSSLLLENSPQQYFSITTSVHMYAVPAWLIFLFHYPRSMLNLKQHGQALHDFDEYQLLH